MQDVRDGHNLVVGGEVALLLQEWGTHKSVLAKSLFRLEVLNHCEDEWT